MTNRTVHQFFGDARYAGKTLQEAADIAQGDYEQAHSGTVRDADEITEAYEQVNSRRWYPRASPDERLNNPNITPEQRIGVASSLERVEHEFPDFKHPKYYSEYSAGYMDGIQSALLWVLGCEWGNTDT